MRRIAILAVLAAACAFGATAQTRPASMSADDAYVRAVAYFETRFDTLRVERSADAAAMAQLRAELTAARRELTALKARGDAPAQTVVKAFAAGDPAAGLDAAEAAARTATGEARARWMQIAALAACAEILGHREAQFIAAWDEISGAHHRAIGAAIGIGHHLGDLLAAIATHAVEHNLDPCRRHAARRVKDMG
jgi:hypothetical protein